ncbi:hypothetical protein E2562_011371 [Oryza meyeriana var. granulata]|uniref:Uncharacterized protein n=1 Tax=Oryza meyeriana var. granulata TaxID=110450 RepID=A0A6G1EA42_9ORYZ|nr:hypothetical protein E2562_011371 [Oryza meyeriana var. granulata]
MAMRWIDDEENRVEVSKNRRSRWLEDIYAGVTGEGETLGSVQQWHAEGPKQARPSKVQHRHAGTVARESTTTVTIHGATRAMRQRAKTDERRAMRRRQHAGETRTAQDGDVQRPDDGGARETARPGAGNSGWQCRGGDDDGRTDGATAWQTGDDRDTQM